MNPCDSIDEMQAPEYEMVLILRENLRQAKLPSLRELASSDTGRRLNAPSGKISFKWAKKVIGKWYFSLAEDPVPS